MIRFAYCKTMTLKHGEQYLLAYFIYVRFRRKCENREIVKSSVKAEK